MKTKSKGFTLIELLVVIAIIGILAAIVLASLSTARSKANAAKVQGQLDEMRNAAEIYYSTNSNYGAATSNCSASLSGLFADPTSGMATLASSTVTAVGGFGVANIDCGSTGSAWSAAALLPGSTAGSANAVFCVDSTGVARTSNGTGAGYTNVTGGTSPAHSGANGTACQ